MNRLLSFFLCADESNRTERKKGVSAMAIKLDHTVIYAKEHRRAAEEFADVMGLSVGRIAGIGYNFSTVHINFELAIYFMNRDSGSLEQHMAFTVDGRTFEQIVNRLNKNNIPYGNSPDHTENKRTDHDFAPRGLFWYNVDGCLFEVMAYDE